MSQKHITSGDAAAGEAMAPLTMGSQSIARWTKTACEIHELGPISGEMTKLRMS